MPPFSSTRWYPTPEQLMILKELYSRGITTPSSSQIQKITAHLSFYGKIHGKNVFYWFQNHKARDRQKLRKKLAIAKQLHQQQQYHHRYSLAENFHPQGDYNGGMMKLAWTAEDLPRDCLIRTCSGHDLTMIPTFACCGNRPPRTLQLFPLTSPGQMDHQEITTSDL